MNVDVITDIFIRVYRRILLIVSQVALPIKKKVKLWELPIEKTEDFHHNNVIDIIDL